MRFGMPALLEARTLRTLSRGEFLALAAAGSLSACTGGAGGIRSGAPPAGSGATVNTDLSGITFFPPTNPWNTPIDTLPVDPASGQMITNHCGSATTCAGVVVDTSLPINVVSGLKPSVSFTFAFASESDPGPYPVLNSMIWENGPFVPGQSKGDHHLLIVDRDNLTLYELYQAYQAPDGSWHAEGGAIFDLTSDKLRPDCWTSADAAGLPIVPGLVRYDEVAADAINHALRFTLSVTRQAFVHPATHYTFNGPKTAGWAPMGARFRLPASFDTTNYSAPMRVILTALKKYGMLLADNGGPFQLCGAPDPRWVSSGIANYPDVFAVADKNGVALKGDQFEVVQLGPLFTSC
jgi:hypothetical protein